MTEAQRQLRPHRVADSLLSTSRAFPSSGNCPYADESGHESCLSISARPRLEQLNPTSTVGAAKSGDQPVLAQDARAVAIEIAAILLRAAIDRTSRTWTTSRTDPPGQWGSVERSGVNDPIGLRRTEQQDNPELARARPSRSQVPRKLD
jgi:hypothetical protein